MLRQPQLPRTLPTRKRRADYVLFRASPSIPDTYGKLALHPKNEEKRKGKQFNRLTMDKALGMTPGASDVIIPLGFACEMKRHDHTKSKWQPGQLEYLKAVHDAGGFACVALGWEAAMEALEDWISQRT